MPKAKSATKRSGSTIHSEDVAEFLDDLEKGEVGEDHQEPVKEAETSSPSEEPADTPPPEEPAEPETPGHKVRVRVDASQQRSTAIKSTVRPPRQPSDTEEPPAPPKNMRTLRPDGGRRAPWGWIFGIASLLVVAAVTGFFVFSRTQRFSGEKVELNMSMTADVASGSEVTLTIRYLNQEPVDLVQAEVNVEYPDGFTFQSASRTSSNKFNNAFSLGTIKRGRIGTMTVTGTLLGAINTQPSFQAVLNYRPANFNSDFQARASTKVKITSSILSLAIEGPNKLAPGATGTWTVTYANTANRALDDIQIEAVYPDGLTITKTDPAAKERSAIWRFDRLDEQAEGKITITGTVTGDVGDALELTLKGGLRTNTGVTPQAEESLLVILVNTGLKTSIVVNGAADKSVVEVGDDLNYAIRLANQSDSELNDATIRVTLTGRALDIQQLDNPAKATVEDTTLTWTKKEVAGLEQIKPGQEVTLRFTTGSQSSLAVTADSDVNPQIQADVFVTSPSLPAADTKPAASIITKFATVFSFTGEARYYDDDHSALGTGPIPPVVSETTSYRIHWYVTNTTSEATDMKISVVLPTPVFWTGKQVSRDAGDVQFDPATRQVTWTLNKVPAGTGSRLPKLTAAFEVSITPVADQVGQSAVLTDVATATATDGFTGKALEVAQSSLTTDLPTDPVASGKGVVEPT